MKHFILLASLFFMLAFTQPVLVWENTFGSGVSPDMVELFGLTYDSNLHRVYAGGYRWGPPPSFHDLVFFVTGDNGTILKDTTIDLGYSEEIHSLVRANDGIWAWGLRQETFKMVGQKFDFDGHGLLSITWGQSDATTRAFGCCLDNNNNVAVTGDVPNWYTMTQAAALNVWSPAGYLRLSANFDTTGTQCGQGIVYHNSYFYVCGYTTEKLNPSLYDGLIFTMSTDGYLLWASTTGFGGSDGLYDIAYDDYRNLLICVGWSRQEVPLRYQGWLCQYTLDGLNYFNQIYPIDSYLRFKTVSIDPVQHHYYIGGFLYDSTAMTYNGIIMKTDSLGEIIWRWEYPNAKIQRVQYIGDGKILFSGSKGWFGWWGMLTDGVGIFESPNPDQDYLSSSGVGTRFIEPASIFDLSGRQIQRITRPGVYFIRQGSNLKKIIQLK